MTQFSVIESVRHLIIEYRSFIKSSYRLADPALRVQFEGHVDDAEVLVKGPYVTLARDFVLGQTLTNLVRDGICHPDLLRLRWPFESHPLFAHQEAALRRVASGGNVIVKTGTGSGKTEAFMLPVLSGVLHMKEQGVAGTKAIFLYPMNALANDQLERIRSLIRETGSSITFALYTGESEAISGTLGEPVVGNELSKREDIRQNPPDIILTNYKQLEFLLIRRADRPIFSTALRYLVLDEIHSYRGALATELACLIRRLKARCSLEAGALRCIGTSATVSQDVGGDQALAMFASDLFAEPFIRSDVIGESYVEPSDARAPYVPPFVHLTGHELALHGHSAPDPLVKLAERLCGRQAPLHGSPAEKIRVLLEGNQFLSALRRSAETPRTTMELAQDLVTQFRELADVDARVISSLVEAYLLVGSYGDDRNAPVIRPKLHTFFHGVYDVGLCMNPGCRTLVRDGADTCPRCGSAVRPAVLCRTCGQDFVKVRFNPDQPEQTLSNDDFLSDEDSAFIAAQLVGDRGDSEDEDENRSEGGLPPHKTRRPRRTAARERLEEVWIDHATGKVFVDRPPDTPAENLSRQHILRGRGTTCPVCNSRFTRGDILSLLRTGVASSASVLATHHLDRLPEGERKILIFADNRQEAAHQAGYMGDRHRQFAMRHAIEAAVRDAGPGGIALQDLPNRVLEIFQRIGLAKRNLTRDEAIQWHKTLEYEVAGEFCRTSHQRIALENLALVEVQYEFLDRLVADPRFEECCHRALLTKAEGEVLVRGILDFMRRRRAVSFDFYQEFLDPKRTPWSWLTVEPYSVSIAEHERGAVFFMFDRPESVRSRPVSGIKFEPLVKDTSKGAAGGVARLVRQKAGLLDTIGDQWTRRVFELLLEYEVVEAATSLPDRVRREIGRGRPLQISKRVVRLIRGASGWRCRKCANWRPYRGRACYATTSCTGALQDLQQSTADRENYYVELYTADKPRRLKALEHTAQIDETTRAEREQAFKDGRVEVLVCSPTLELGVNIGDLYSVLLRNAPPGPANYVQRAGRAGRRWRIGFVSTFCGMGPHDRHCFEDPAWLVRGDFKPPLVRLNNERIVERHVRSLALEELNQDFSWLMGDLLDDIQNPASLKPERYASLLASLRDNAAVIAARAKSVFGGAQNVEETVARLPRDIEEAIRDWHILVKRLYKEFQEYARIVATRETDQKRRARERAYRELTHDRRKAHVLTYLSEIGLLPSYQFPTDTFALDPGVGDTPTLRRSAWIALFEFAPGNMVYANGHKLKSIRAFFEGRSRSGPADRGADKSGRVEPLIFCERCGFASRGAANNCPKCGLEIRHRAEVALIESFEAEENTQITSAEDSRQRLTFDRRENLLDDVDATAEIHSYEFVAIELRRRARLLVTNWGRQVRWGAGGDQFELCPECGRHRPHGLSERTAEKWDNDHRQRCVGNPRRFVLGYEFSADVLTLPIPRQLVPEDELESKSFARTLGQALLVGAQELLEIEADEISFFTHPDGARGWSLHFYETMPGGAGYLSQLAINLPRWAASANARLFNHDCERACYRCLKSYRNQFDHALLNKEVLRDILFHLRHAERRSEPKIGSLNEAAAATRAWLDALSRDRRSVGTADTPIERALLEAIERGGRLPKPASQLQIHLDDGALLTVPDFAYPEVGLAIYCDGFAYHGNADALVSDARKRNALQAMGWAVLTFWGRQILRDPGCCEEQIWQCYRGRSLKEKTSRSPAYTPGRLAATSQE